MILVKCILSFKENSDKESNKHRYDPFKDIVLCSRDFFTQLSVELSNFFLNIRNLLTSSENREVKVSGLKKGFNEHFSLLFIKASFLKAFNILMSIKSFIMHSNLFVFHKKVSSYIKYNSCEDYTIKEARKLSKNVIYKKENTDIYKWRIKGISEVIRSPLINLIRFVIIKVYEKVCKIILITGITVVLNITNVNAEPCVGKFVNPIKDICWSCIFPIKIGNTSIYSGGRQDTDNPSKIICVCPTDVGIGVKVPLPGLAISFWEPVRLADVTRTPYCMVSLGGFQIMKSSKKHGTVARKNANEALKHSFYQVHYYIYPLIYWLELLADFICMEQMSIDIAYMSEFDPLWGNDKLNMILNPEAALFGNPIAQTACIFDCIKATTGFSSDMLFHCAGCNGSLYPFGGSIEHTQGGVQASTLIVERLLARLHRVGLAWDTVSDSCEKTYAPKIKKTQYKLQMTYPVSNTKRSDKLDCNPFGRSSAIWGAGKETPGNGEDFGYLVWRKRYCCFTLITELAAMAVAGGGK